jgi:type IV pilus assembly protein PilQ
MKVNFRLFVFFLVFCLLPIKLNATQDMSFQDPDVTISMDFQDASLKDIMKILSIQSGMNFIASEAVEDRKITLYFDKVPLEEVMGKLFKANNLSYDLDPDSNIFIVKDWGKPQMETITKIFYLKYATVSSSSLKEEMSSQISSSATSSSSSSSGKWKAETDVGITQAVKKNLTANGSIIEDYRTNSLIVTDIPSRMPIIERLIASLDLPIPQVLLEVEMLDVSKNMVDKLGFNFSDNPFTMIFGSRAGSEFFIGNLAKKGLDLADSGVAGYTLFGRTYAQLLDFLRTRTDTKTLARPRLLTLNNETAEIKIETDEVTGRTKSTSGETTQMITYEAERSPTGVSLRITPQINLDTGEITMFLYPSLKEASDSTIKDEDGQPYKNVEERGTKSLVKVKNGDTVIIGGLIRSEYYETIAKLPILGDIPIMGALFRHKNKTKDKERELLVFITPHIIKDTTTGFASAKKAKIPAREQNMGSALGRQTAINSSLSNFEKIK